MTITILPQNKRKDYQERLERLKPHQFKPGNNANPKGRPKAIITKKEKLELLSEIARHTIQSAVSAGHKIAAIREANLMEGVYQEAQAGSQGNRVITIIVLSERAKELTENVSNRFRQLEPAEAKGESRELLE